MWRITCRSTPRLPSDGVPTIRAINLRLQLGPHAPFAIILADQTAVGAGVAIDHATASEISVARDDPASAADAALPQLREQVARAALAFGRARAAFLQLILHLLPKRIFDGCADAARLRW